jgi:hypothetical protein
MRGLIKELSVVRAVPNAMNTNISVYVLSALLSGQVNATCAWEAAPRENACI